LGVSYKTAPLCVREKLTFDSETMLACGRGLVARKLLRKVAILSTCHRTEFYCDGLSPPNVNAFWQWLETEWQLPGYAALEGSIYQLTDTTAVKHLLRVSAGLDSLILGETQILGQMKTAYDQALAGVRWGNT